MLPEKPGKNQKNCNVMAQQNDFSNLYFRIAI
jgi:hypothetical protein